MSSNLENENEEVINFEKAMERLEEVVASMESGESPLSELVDRHEEGARLLKLCRDQLEEAELKIQNYVGFSLIGVMIFVILSIF